MTNTTKSVKLSNKDDPKHDIGYLLRITLLIGLSSMNFGFCMAATGPIIPALRYQLNWDPQAIDLNSTILTTSNIVGMSMGCIFGGDFIKNGRRQTMIQFNVIALMGTVIAMFLNFWQMCCGRFIYGAATGVLMCTTPKMVEEIIRAKLMNKGFGMSTSLFINIAFFGCLILGGGMQDE